MDTDQAFWIGAKVRVERERRGLTQRQLGEAAGVAGNTVVAIEAGRSVRPGSLAKVRDYLGLDFVGKGGGPFVDAGEAMVRAFLRAEDNPDELERRLAHLAGAIASYRG